MRTSRLTRPGEHGHPDVRASRYAVLAVALVGWGVLGMYLLSQAYWPSTCTPEGLIDAYRCSIRLPEKRGWVEAALLTWLWATPILLLLELGPRIRRCLSGGAPPRP